MTEEKHENPQLTAEEIKILKQMVEGQKAMRWLRMRSTSVATWVSLIIGTYLAVTGQLSAWIKNLAGGQ